MRRGRRRHSNVSGNFSPPSTLRDNDIKISTQKNPIVNDPTDPLISASGLPPGSRPSFQSRPFLGVINKARDDEAADSQNVQIKNLNKQIEYLKKLIKEKDFEIEHNTKSSPERLETAAALKQKEYSEKIQMLQNQVSEQEKKNEDKTNTTDMSKKLSQIGNKLSSMQQSPNSEQYKIINVLIFIFFFCFLMNVLFKILDFYDVDVEQSYSYIIWFSLLFLLFIVLPYKRSVFDQKNKKNDVEIAVAIAELEPKR